MTNRERVQAIMHFQPVDRVPVVAFGYWGETLEKWADEGHFPKAWLKELNMGDGAEGDRAVMEKLGFDFNWQPTSGAHVGLNPSFERTVLSEDKDGSILVRDHNGLLIREKPSNKSIPSQVGTTLVDREAWEEHYVHRLQFSEDRIPYAHLEKLKAENDTRENPLGFHCGSLYGFVRDLMGVEELSYVQLDDPELYEEIINTCADVCYRVLEKALSVGVKFDYAHFWEDICFKNGPLVHPATFERCVGPHYKRMTDLLRKHGVDIISLDCDGCIDLLIPTWLDNGVNTMFPIEVGTWNASIGPWREKYGRRILGVGGMDKRVFAQDKAAVDREIERLRPLVEMGGYIPCPDHRIAPDAIWENVVYYCERFRHVFG
ncbi:MAG: hypothetical protein E7335_10860 [Clostridiales bacterium]|nr:hypothetical protein [Clostridiales bacterium]